MAMLPISLAPFRPAICDGCGAGLFQIPSGEPVKCSACKRLANAMEMLTDAQLIDVVGNQATDDALLAAASEELLRRLPAYSPAETNDQIGPDTAAEEPERWDFLS